MSDRYEPVIPPSTWIKDTLLVLATILIAVATIAGVITFLHLDDLLASILKIFGID